MADVLEGRADWVVVEGDCREALRAMPNGTVDLVVTDPPYGHNNNNGDLIANREKALGRGAAGPARPIANDGPEANDLLRAVLPDLNRLMHSGGCCCCCCCGGGGPDPQFARWSLWLDEVFDFKQMVVWDKGPMGMGWHYRRSYETVLVSQKRGGKCRWYDDSKRVENVIRPGHNGIRKIIPKATDHPTPKPWQLAAHFIGLHSTGNHLVLDPFAGAGWVGEAALRAGRRFIGIEIDAHWATIARERLRSVVKTTTSSTTATNARQPDGPPTD